MTFNSLPFVLLVTVTYISVLIIKNESRKKGALLIASYVFYAYWDVRFLFLMLFEELVCYFIAIRIKKKKQKKTLILGLIILLGVLILFKYYKFFDGSISKLIGKPNLLSIDIILPIGISFYTFQSISYLVDVWRGEVDAQNSFLDLSLYISFFPQLVAGPIMRAKDFLTQLESKVVLSRKNLIEGIQIFVFGLFKKVVVADRLAVCVDSVFSAPAAYSGISIICAMISYSIQILCDFSGYTDMAIGTAKIFGFDLCMNFNAPYLAKNPSEFWRRWHISLSQWLRDYLYIPLGGSRRGKARTYINLMITMILGGLWHGAAWNFVAWGTIHGVALVIHRLYAKSKARRRLVSAIKDSYYNVISGILNCCFIICSWVVFRLESLNDIKTVFVRAFTLADGIQYIYTYTVIAAIILILYYGYIQTKHSGKSVYFVAELITFREIFVFLFLLWIIALFGYSGNNAFIYFQF